MQPFRYIAPFASLAILTLVAALPWGLPPEDRFFLPLLPIVAIHYWSLRHGSLIPEWAVFLAGLTLDVLTHGPLGYWSLIYLVAHSLAILSAPIASRGVAARIGLFALALVAVTVMAWAVSSVYFLEPADWRPYAFGAGLAGIAALLLVPLLRSIDVQQGTRGNPRLLRGG